MPTKASNTDEDKTGHDERPGKISRSTAVHHEEDINQTFELRRAAAMLEGRLSNEPAIDAVRRVLDVAHAYYGSVLDDPLLREGHGFDPLNLEAAYNSALARGELPSLKASAVLDQNAVGYLGVVRAYRERVFRYPIWGQHLGASAGWLYRRMMASHDSTASTEADKDGPGAVTVGLATGDIDPSDDDREWAAGPPPDQPPHTRLAQLDSMHEECGASLGFAMAVRFYMPHISAFLDQGNAKVNRKLARLLCEAALTAAGVGGAGLWTLTRGLAMHDSEKRAADGEAIKKIRAVQLVEPYSLPLSLVRLYIDRSLDIAASETRFMTGLVTLPNIMQGINSLCERRSTLLGRDIRAISILKAALLNGWIPRGAAAELTGLEERRARDVLSECLADGLLIAKNERGAVALNIPLYAASHLFPGLMPIKDRDDAMMRSIRAIKSTRVRKRPQAGENSLINF